MHHSNKGFNYHNRLRARRKENNNKYVMYIDQYYFSFVSSLLFWYFFPLNTFPIKGGWVCTHFTYQTWRLQFLGKLRKEISFCVCAFFLFTGSYTAIYISSETESNTELDKANCNIIHWVNLELYNFNLSM